MLLPDIAFSHLLPAGRQFLKTVVAAEIHEVEDVVLEAAAPEAGAGLQKLPSIAAGFACSELRLRCC